MDAGVTAVDALIAENDEIRAVLKEIVTVLGHPGFWRLHKRRDGHVSIEVSVTKNTTPALWTGKSMGEAIAKAAEALRPAEEVQP